MPGGFDGYLALDEIRSFREKRTILWLQINIRNTKH
jgi:hypothetical protein